MGISECKHLPKNYWNKSKAAAGVLTSALSPLTDNGWGNLRGGEQPENSNQILSPDPESQNDFPMRSPERLAYTPPIFFRNTNPHIRFLKHLRLYRLSYP